MLDNTNNVYVGKDEGEGETSYLLYCVTKFGVVESSIDCVVLRPEELLC